MTNIIPREKFVKDCGIANKNLTVYAARGNVVINSVRCERCEKMSRPCKNCRTKEYIDLNYRSQAGHYLNLDFYKKNAQGADIKQKPHAGGRKKKVKEEKQLLEKSVVIGREEADESEIDHGREYGDLSEQSSEDALDRANKFMLYQNREANLRAKELEEARTRGELMLVTDAKQMIAIFAESTRRVHSDAGENVLMLLFEMFNVPDNQRVIFRDKLVGSINTAVKNSVAVAQREMESLNGSQQD